MRRFIDWYLNIVKVYVGKAQTISISKFFQITNKLVNVTQNMTCWIKQFLF